MVKRSCFMVALLLVTSSVFATEFYIDPEHGAPGNDGSAEKPWRSLQAVIDAGLVQTRAWNAYPFKPESGHLVPKNADAPIKPGDTIFVIAEDQPMGLANLQPEASDESPQQADPNQASPP